MADKVRWGVIGSGGIARRRTIPEGIVPAGNAELAAVCDVDAEANAEVAREFGAAAGESVQSLLGGGIDAVYVATPADLHHRNVLACAEAGKHVLCEKPLGMTVAEAGEMIAACERADVKLGSAFMMRFQSQHQAALKLIEDGKLGKLSYGRAQLSCWYPPIEGAWRQDPARGGGGSLMDMGGHCIDLLEMFFGPVESVSCMVNRTVHDYASEDTAVATLFFQNGALGTVDNLFCVPDAGSKNALELYGSKGSILAVNTIGQGDSGHMLAYIEESGGGYDAHQARADQEAVAVAPRPINTYRAEIEEFSGAILEDRRPSNSAQLGLQSQKVLASCYESAKTGKVVAIR